MALIPVCKGTVTGARSMMGVASRSIGNLWLKATGPFSSRGCPSGSITRPIGPSADRNAHHASSPPDFRARTQVGTLAQQDDSDLVLVDIDGNAKKFTGKLDQFVITNIRKTGHRCDAGRNSCDRADFSTARRGWNFSRAWARSGEGSPPKRNAAHHLDVSSGMCFFDEASNTLSQARKDIRLYSMKFCDRCRQAQCRQAFPASSQSAQAAGYQGFTDSAFDLYSRARAKSNALRT